MTTKVELTDDKKLWNVLYSNNGKDFKVHKTFKKFDDAMKETTIINGGIKFLKDVLQQSK